MLGNEVGVRQENLKGGILQVIVSNSGVGEVETEVPNKFPLVRESMYRERNKPNKRIQRVVYDGSNVSRLEGEQVPGRKQWRVLLNKLIQDPAEKAARR